MGESGNGKDWFWPFLKAMCAWPEQQYRLDVGLPLSLSLPGHSVDSHVLSVAYGNFMTLVLSDVPDPYNVWNDMIESLS